MMLTRLHRASQPDFPACHFSVQTVYHQIAMLGDRTNEPRSNEQWIAQYAGSHQHPVNRVFHTVGIPAILLSVVLFLGAIIIHGRPSNPSDPDVYEVIDGQQRITTIYLYLCAVVRTLCKYGEYGEAIGRDILTCCRPSS